MSRSYVEILYKTYRELVGPKEISGLPIQEGTFYFSPLPLSPERGLWIEIVPHDTSKSRFTHSATLRLYAPSEQVDGDARIYLELQACDADDPKLPAGILPFVRMSRPDVDLKKVDISRTILQLVKEMVRT